MIGRVLAGFGILLPLATAVPVLPTAAASFDCSKAASAFERAICTSPDLSVADDKLAVAYATAIGGLSKPAYAVMRENQRDWLDFAERACTDDAEPQTNDYTEEQLTCLQSEFAERFSDLEPSRMLNGWRFYMDETFQIAKADQEESGSNFNKVAKTAYSSPRIDGDSSTATEFNAFAAELLQTVSGGASDEGGEIDRISDFDTRLAVTSASGSRITITINESWYGHGAAHGNYQITYAHFLVADGRALMAADVFANDDDWQEPLAKLTLDALKTSLGEFMWEDLDALISQAVTEVKRWDFSEEGLVLQFQPYEVTSYAGGAPTVTIPWGKLEPLLTGTVYGVISY